MKPPPPSPSRGNDRRTRRAYLPAPTLHRRRDVPRESRSKIDGISVILPVYNEEHAVASTVARIQAVLTDRNSSFEIIAVDDGSTDATVDELSACQRAYGLRVLRNKTNRGYGFSLKRAIHEAKHETIIIADADGTYPLEAIPELLDAFQGADMVVGARIGANVNVPLVRRPAKWCLTKLARYLTRVNIPDLNSGLRVMRRGLVRRFAALLPDGFSFTTTITLAALTHNCTVKYVPIDYAKRVGRSSIRPIRDTINFANLIVRTILYFKPLKIFVPVAAALFALSISIALLSKFVLGQLADVTCVTLATASVQTLTIGLLADLIEKRSPAFS